jgi:hypothetical protein
LRNLYFRIGHDDLPLFVTAAAIRGDRRQSRRNLRTGRPSFATLQDAAQDPRWRRKGGIAMILSSLPIAMFLIISGVARFLCQRLA